eukprot:6744078-Pyramimonas_sp.AAC.1
MYVRVALAGLAAHETDVLLKQMCARKLCVIRQSYLWVAVTHLSFPALQDGCLVAAVDDSGGCSATARFDVGHRGEVRVPDLSEVPHPAVHVPVELDVVRGAVEVQGPAFAI